jgi:hypothetical protein
MSLINRSKKEIEASDGHGQIPDKLSIQDALTILNVYGACQDPDDCRDHIERIVKIEQKRLLFKEISESEEDTERRINRYHIMLQNEDSTEIAIDQAVNVLLPDHGQRAFELAVQTCKELGLTHTRIERLHDIAAKLSIDISVATEMIPST